MTTSTRTLLSSIIRDSFYMAIDPEEAVDLVLDVLERPSNSAIATLESDMQNQLDAAPDGERLCGLRTAQAFIAAIREGK